ncbi:Rv0361 family membrane protein [Actinokineospora globicatena]|uniref:DUF4878 domain-containing protein n=1 Tax=Actinokineospora globicatena TaxID=103729 RepID=A0A9W6QR55_9PSEU|nr:hypothetical protein [Actinokineospora globicatena]GLW95033.1 hypothetical protein Aglo03_58490 [Actinokineospora globicatena]
MTQPPHDPHAGQPQEPGQHPDQGGYQQAFPGQTQFLPAGAFPGPEQNPPPAQDPYATPGTHGAPGQQPAPGQYGQSGPHAAQPPGYSANFPQSGQQVPGQPGADPAAGGQFGGGQYPAQPGGGQYPQEQFQQQYPQGAYGQQPAQFPQAGGYPQQPGGYPQGPYGGPTYGPVRRSPMPWVLAGGGLVVIGIIVTLILVLSGDGTGSPRGTTEAFIDAVKSRDAEAFNRLMCDEDGKTTQKEIDEDRDVQITDTSVTNVTESGDTAVGEFSATIGGRSTKVRLQLKKRDDVWCVDRIGRG